MLQSSSRSCEGGLNFQHLHYITIAVCCHFFPFIITISIYITFSVTFSMYFHYDRGHFFLVVILVSKQSNDMDPAVMYWCVCETRPGGQWSGLYQYFCRLLRLLLLGTIQEIRGQQGEAFYDYIIFPLTWRMRRCRCQNSILRPTCPCMLAWSPAAVCGGGVCSVTRASSGQASDQQVAAISPQHLNTSNNVSSVSLVSIMLLVS